MDKIFSVTPAPAGWRYVVLDGDNIMEDHVAVWFAKGTEEDGILYVVPGIPDETGSAEPVWASDYPDHACVGLFGPTVSEEEIKAAVTKHKEGKWFSGRA